MLTCATLKDKYKQMGAVNKLSLKLNIQKPKQSFQVLIKMKRNTLHKVIGSVISRVNEFKANLWVEQRL